MSDTPNDPTEPVETADGSRRAIFDESAAPDGDVSVDQEPGQGEPGQGEPEPVAPEPEAPAGGRRRLRTPSRWVWVAAAGGVLTLGLGAAAAGHELVDGDRHDRDGRGGGQHRDGESDADRRGGRETRRDRSDDVGELHGPDTASSAGPADGPIVIEPSTPGGERTVVWPDGRIVMIPAGETATTPSTTTTTTIPSPG